MWSSLDYAGFAQLCRRSPIMREIMCEHNRIIPRSLVRGKDPPHPGWSSESRGLISFQKKPYPHQQERFWQAWEWRTLGVADPGGGGPWGWRTLDGGPLPSSRICRLIHHSPVSTSACHSPRKTSGDNKLDR